MKHLGLFILILLTGCSITRGAYDLRKLSKITMPSFGNSSPMALKLVVGAYHQNKGERAGRTPANPAAGALVAERAFDLLERTGMFRDIVTGRNAVYDVQLEVRLVFLIDPGSERTVGMLRVINMMFLGMVPVWTMDGFVLEIEATDRQGNQVFEKEYRDYQITYTWLPIALLNLLWTEDPNEVIYNAGRHAMREFSNAVESWQRSH